MLIAARKLARTPIVLTCFGVAVLSSVVAGGVTPNIGLVLVIIVLLVIHGNSINDLADYDIDKVNLKNANDRPLVSKDITTKQLWWLHGICGLVAILLSFFFGPIAGTTTLAVAIYNYAYSFRPFRITDKTILSPLTLSATYAFQPFTLGYWSTNQPTSYSWLLATAIYLGFIARILLKDFRDVKGDAKFGKQTFLIRYGNRATCIASGVCAFASFALISFAIEFSAGTFIVLVAGNLTALWLLTNLATTKKLAEQMRLISLISKIGNCSILTLLVYYICKNYLSGQLVWLVLLPLLFGLTLLLLIWRSSARDTQIQLA